MRRIRERREKRTAPLTVKAYSPGNDLLKNA
jgi:hypothetical protein